MNQQPYRAALVYISTNPGTSSALGLAKLVLSLYNRIHPFSLGACVFGLDELRTKMAGDMVTEYLNHGESPELLEVGAIVKTMYPDLIDLSKFVFDACQQRRQAEFEAKLGGGGMTSSQLDRLDEYAQRLIDNPDDGSFGVLSTGERIYVLLAASRADLLDEYQDTVPEALARLGASDAAALVERWGRRHYQPFVPGKQEAR